MEKKLTVEKGNRAIALFMGAKIGNPVGKTEVLINVPDFYSNRTTSTHATEYLQYHKRWDWLMPVVEKIQSIDISPAPNYRGYRIEIVVQGYVKIEGFPMPPIFTNVSREGSLIKAVWQAVVQFIQWYSKSKQSA